MESTFSVEVPVNTSFNERVLNFITSPEPTPSDLTDSSEASEFDSDDFEALSRFQNRTVFTIGTTSSQQVYQKVVPALAREHPFVMHLVVTLTLMHDRFLTDVRLEKCSTQTESEAYHWYQGTVIFNKKLREIYSPMTSSEADAMWAGALSLGCIAFYCVEGDLPQDVWPLKPAGPLDLDWLKISDGKKEVWRVANPLRADSCFAPLAAEQTRLLAPNPDPPELPEGFKELWDFPLYEKPAALVGQLMHIKCDRSTVLLFLGMISRMEPQFLIALTQRDPKAMLLLSVWYAKLCPYRSWWTMRRAVLESQAICVYLEQHHPDLVHGVGKHLFAFVKSESGLDRGWGWRDFAREAGFAGALGKEGYCEWRESHPIFVGGQPGPVEV
jgi:hypothetical protein